MGDDDEMGSLFVNPINLMTKIDKTDNDIFVVEDRYLNSVSNLTNYFWPQEKVHMILTKVNG